MAYLDVVASSSGLKYDAFSLGGLYITRSVFTPGMWQTMRFPVDIRFCDLFSKHFQPRGRFVNTDNVLPAREPGWVSTTDEFLVPAGQYRREAETETEVWCVQAERKETDTSHVALHKLAPGETCLVPNNRHLFIASGACSVDGRALPGPAYFWVQTGDKAISAQTETYLMHWLAPSKS